MFEAYQTTSTLPRPSLNQTGLALALLVPISILPGAVYPSPPVTFSTNMSFEGCRFSDLKFRFLSEINVLDTSRTVLENFASTLLEDIVDTNPEISQITRGRFFDMYEDF